MSNLQRRALLKAAACACLTAPLAPLARLALAEGVPPGMHHVKGRVTVNGVAAHEGSDVKVGDTVATEVGAEAVYVIGKDAFLQRASSQVSFGADALRVLTGGLLSAFGKGEKNIVTPAAVIGIRGTACDIEVEEQRTYFCLCYGTADVQPFAAPEQRRMVTATHHDAPLYIYTDRQMREKLIQAKMIGHTDEELIMLEGLVGRKPPFVAR